MKSPEDIGSAASDAPASAKRGCCGHGHDEQHSEHHEAHAESGCCTGHDSSAGGCCGGGGGAHTRSDQILVFSRKQIRELDRLAVEEFAIPSIILMENAARGIAGVIVNGLQGINDPSVLIVCGPGNNGGDGLALARHLSNRSIPVAIVLAVPEPRYDGDALTNLRIARNMGLPIFDAVQSPVAAMTAAAKALGQPVVVADALLGTGLDRPATGIMADLITQMNALKTAGCTLVAINVPSGMDCDTGAPASDGATSGPAVKADLTIALAGIKAGYMTQTAQAYCGELVVVEIGVPRALAQRLGRPLGSASGSCCQGSHAGQGVHADEHAGQHAG